jgi:hypothetical protein
MKRVPILILIAVSLAVTSCRWLGIRGNGNVGTEQLPVADFSELQADGHGMFDIEWRSGPPALSITTDQNLMKYVEARVIDNQLRLHVRERILPTDGLKVRMSSSNRTSARLRGASQLVAPELTGNSFAIETTGASEVKLDGTVNRLLADMTGASQLNAKSLQVRTAEISTTGAGRVDVSVSETLRVMITGAGEVTYRGNPSVQKHVVGAGEVRHKD